MINRFHSCDHALLCKLLGTKEHFYMTRVRSSRDFFGIQTSPPFCFVYGRREVTWKRSIRQHYPASTFQNSPNERTEFYYFQFFTLTRINEIQFNDDKCLDAPRSEPGSFVEMITCHGLKGNQEWKHDKNKVKFLACKHVTKTMVKCTTKPRSLPWTRNQEYSPEVVLETQ